MPGAEKIYKLIRTTLGIAHIDINQTVDRIWNHIQARLEIDNQIIFTVIALAEIIMEADKHATQRICKLFKHLSNKIQQVGMIFYIRNLYNVICRASELEFEGVHNFLAQCLQKINLNLVSQPESWFFLALCQILKQDTTNLDNSLLADKLFSECLKKNEIRLRVICKNLDNYIRQSFESIVEIICQELLNKDVESASIICRMGYFCTKASNKQIEFLSKSGFFQKLVIWSLKKNRYEYYIGFLGNLMNCNREICWIAAIDIFQRTTVCCPILLGEINLLQPPTEMDRQKCANLATYWIKNRIAFKTFFDDEVSFEFLMKLISRMCNILEEEQTLTKLMEALELGGFREKLAMYEASQRQEIWDYYKSKGEQTLYQHIEGLFKMYRAN